MPTHIFKKTMPREIVKSFMEKIAIKAEKHYIVNYESLKKAKYETCYDDFLNTIKPYYYNSKQHYVEHATDYKKFLTILRQICNFNNIAYKPIVTYSHSKSFVEYHIYYSSLDEPDTILLPK